MEEKVSVIIPIYKVEKYLDRCIESVVKQTYKNIEIILVDDGSPDGCGEMCDNWANKDFRIKVIHKKNGGLSDARNAGIDLMSGDYLMFIDSDDYVGANIIETLLILAKENNAEISMCGCQEFYEQEEIKENMEDSRKVVLKEEEIKQQIYNQTIDYIVTAWAKLYKREIFENIRFPFQRVHEDEFVFHKIFSMCKTFAYINERLYFYLQRSSSIMGKIKEKNVVDSFDAYLDRYNFLLEIYPNDILSINQMMLSKLRGLYLNRAKGYKPIRKKIFEEYKKIYKQTSNKTLKDKLFRRFKYLYIMLFNLKKERNK